MRALWGAMTAALLLGVVAATASGASDGYVYVSAEYDHTTTADNKILKVACDGSGATSLVTGHEGLAQYAAMAVLEVGGVEYLYWVPDDYSSTMQRIKTDGTGSAEVVYTAPGSELASVSGLVTDGSRLWWAAEDSTPNPLLFTAPVSSIAATQLTWTPPTGWRFPSLTLAAGQLFTRSNYPSSSSDRAIFSSSVPSGSYSFTAPVAGAPAAAQNLSNAIAAWRSNGTTVIYGADGSGQNGIARTVVGGATDAAWGTLPEQYPLGKIAVSSSGTVIATYGVNQMAGNGALLVRGAGASTFSTLYDLGDQRNQIRAIAVSGACTLTRSGGGGSEGGGSGGGGGAAAAAASTAAGAGGSPAVARVVKSNLRTSTVRNGIVTTSVTVDGPGAARLEGERVETRAGRAVAPRAVCSARVVFAKAGTKVLRCVPNAATQALRATGPVRVRLTLTFAPKGGKAAVVSSRSVTLPQITVDPADPVTG